MLMIEKVSVVTIVKDVEILDIKPQHFIAPHITKSALHLLHLPLLGPTWFLLPPLSLPRVAWAF
jgi:hypothetical protein